MGQCYSRFDLPVIITCCRRPRQAAPPTPPLRRRHNIRRQRRRVHRSPGGISRDIQNAAHFDRGDANKPTDMGENSRKTKEKASQTEDAQKNTKNASNGGNVEGENKTTTKDAATTTDHSKLFASVALKNNDTWIIHGSKEDLGSMYMVKKIAPHELHEPHLCLRGLSFHQQHREPSHVETIRDIIRSCIKLLNDRVGTPPQRSISMMELSCSQVNTKRILWHRRSLSLPDPKKHIESEPPEPFSIYPKWCGSYGLLQSYSESDGECSYNLGSKSAILSNRENSFSSNMLPLNTLSQGVTSNVIISDCVESEDIIGPPTQFCNTVKLLKNEPDENYFLDDDVFNLQEADTSFYKTIEKIDNTLFENELHSPTMPSSTEEKLLFSMDSSDDLFFSNTGTSSRKKPVNAPCGMEPCLLYCDSFTREDPAALNVPETEEKTMFWEFHVLYSVSYCVPVLFFQVWDSDGKMVSLQELWRIVDTKFQGRLRQDKWSILTQQEHPLLRRPFYFLHPCGTESLLKILKPSWNPLVSWLMTIGPSIGLNICPLYGQSRDEPEPQTILKNKEAVI